MEEDANKRASDRVTVQDAQPRPYSLTPHWALDHTRDAIQKQRAELIKLPRGHEREAIVEKRLRTLLEQEAGYIQMCRSWDAREAAARMAAEAAHASSTADGSTGVFKFLGSLWGGSSSSPPKTSPRDSEPRRDQVPKERGGSKAGKAD